VRSELGKEYLSPLCVRLPLNVRERAEEMVKRGEKNGGIFCREDALVHIELSILWKGVSWHARSFRAHEGSHHQAE